MSQGLAALTGRFDSVARNREIDDSSRLVAVRSVDGLAAGCLLALWWARAIRPGTLQGCGSRPDGLVYGHAGFHPKR